MPFRHSDKFSDWLDLTKIQLGRWNPGLFRNATPSDVPSRESRWDQAPATPSASGTPASSSSLSPNLVRLGPRSPSGNELLLNLSNVPVGGARSLDLNPTAIDAMKEITDACVAYTTSSDRKVSLSDFVDMRALFCEGRSKENCLSQNLCDEDQYNWCSRSVRIANLVRPRYAYKAA